MKNTIEIKRNLGIKRFWSLYFSNIVSHHEPQKHEEIGGLLTENGMKCSLRGWFIWGKCQSPMAKIYPQFVKFFQISVYKSRCSLLQYKRVFPIVSSVVYCMLDSFLYTKYMKRVEKWTDIPVLGGWVSSVFSIFTLVVIMTERKLMSSVAYTQ